MDEVETYALSYTGEEIEERLAVIEDLYGAVSALSPIYVIKAQQTRINGNLRTTYLHPNFSYDDCMNNNDITFVVLKDADNDIFVYIKCHASGNYVYFKNLVSATANYLQFNKTNSTWEFINNIPSSGGGETI